MTTGDSIKEIREEHARAEAHNRAKQDNRKTHIMGGFNIPLSPIPEIKQDELLLTPDDNSFYELIQSCKGRLIDDLKEADFHIAPITSSFLWMERVIEHIAEVFTKAQLDKVLKHRLDRPCPDCKGTGMGQFYFNKNAPCDTCKGTGEVEDMDRPELRKAQDILEHYFDGACDDLAKEIDALYPDIEQIDAMLVEAKRTAKKQEKERVLGILQGEYPPIDTWQCWKDLKGG